jgi:hypothetical protein
VYGKVLLPDYFGHDFLADDHRGERVAQPPRVC